MMDEYVLAALRRIRDWDQAEGPTIVAIKVELETMYAAGYANALKSKNTQAAIDHWLAAQNEDSA